MPRRPNPLYFLAIGVVLTIVALSVSGALDGGDARSSAVEPPPVVSATPTAIPLAPTATPEPASQAAPPPPADRVSCGEISGTAYRSDPERDWFRQNCVSP